MFEKEAEEIMMQKVIEMYDCIMTPCKTLEDCQLCDFCFDDMVDAFKDGAEFGYKKGIKAKINTTTISDCPIKDEWHYVKDGDYPKENQWVLVYYDGSYTVCNYHSYTPIKWLDTYENEVFEGSVIAWKEIVLPKESE